jgi:hypothetical protein
MDICLIRIDTRFSFRHPDPIHIRLGMIRIRIHVRLSKEVYKKRMSGYPDNSNHPDEISCKIKG